MLIPRLIFALMLVACLSGCVSRRVNHNDLVAIVSKPLNSWEGWIYNGSTESDHYLTKFAYTIPFVQKDRYVISTQELLIPRTYTRRGWEECEYIFETGINSVPDYELYLSPDHAVLTAVMSNGAPRWVKRYYVDTAGRCLPHGKWKRYDLLGRVQETTMYRHGKVSGKHWIKLDSQKHGAYELESYWNDREPVGTWIINPDDCKHILIHFVNGSEVLKESFGASYGKKILLRRWVNEIETYKGDWVRAAAPQIADKAVYLRNDLHPDFEPEVTTVTTLRGLIAHASRSNIQNSEQETPPNR